jgi:5-methylcytosine-specific restriction endonuclease McrA
MPFDRSKYPADWEQIRARTLERAGHKCERCGVSNRVVGYREKSGEFVQLAASKGECGMETETASLDGHKVIEIVLTIAHVGENKHGKMDTSQLEALCQRCHLREDIEEHRVNAAATRGRKWREAAQKAGQMEMLEL